MCLGVLSYVHAITRQVTNLPGMQFLSIAKLIFGVSGYLPAGHFLEQKIVSYPHLCDPDYVVDVKKDWVGMDEFKPIPLP